MAQRRTSTQVVIAGKPLWMWVTLVGFFVFGLICLTLIYANIRAIQERYPYIQSLYFYCDGRVANCYEWAGLQYSANESDVRYCASQLDQNACYDAKLK